MASPDRRLALVLAAAVVCAALGSDVAEMSEGEVVADAPAAPLEGAALRGAFHNALLKELQRQAATPALGRDLYDGWLDERVVQRASQDDAGGELGESKGEVKDPAREAMPGDTLAVLKAKARAKARQMLKLELQNHKLVAANALHPRAGATPGLNIGKEIRKARSTRLYKSIETADTSATWVGREGLEDEKSKVIKLIHEKYHEQNKDAVLQKVEMLFNKWLDHGAPEDAADIPKREAQAAQARRKAEKKAAKKAVKKAAARKVALAQETKFNAANKAVAKAAADKRQVKHKLAKTATPSQIAKVAAMKAAVPKKEAKALRNAGVDVTKVMADHIKASTAKEDDKAARDAKTLKKAAAKEAVNIEKKLKMPN